MTMRSVAPPCGATERQTRDSMNPNVRSRDYGWCAVIHHGPRILAPRLLPLSDTALLFDIGSADAYRFAGRMPSTDYWGLSPRQFRVSAKAFMVGLSRYRIMSSRRVAEGTSP